MEHEFNFPIKYVTRQTGLSSYIIRAWEKRYGAVKPARTETNRRRYSQDDIGRLMLLKKAVGTGIPIGDVAQLETAALERLVETALLPNPEWLLLNPLNPKASPNRITLTRVWKRCSLWTLGPLRPPSIKRW